MLTQHAGDMNNAVQDGVKISNVRVYFQRIFDSELHASEYTFTALYANKILAVTYTTAHVIMHLVSLTWNCAVLFSLSLSKFVYPCKKQ